ncbi:SpoIIE family protein phosphatase [Desulfitobacterium dichloroeliminans]|nr:PP2C family protein-serine/threonine phosphatase [Desulfitobacterium dichloroeliminans]
MDFCESTSDIFARVFEYAQEGISITNPQGEIIYVNPAFTQTTGYTLAEALGKNPRILKSGRHAQQFYTSMWGDLAVKGQWQGEIWNRRKNGEIYPEWLNIHAVRHGELGLTHYVAIFRDITEDMRIRQEVELAGRIQKRILRSDFANEKLTMKSIFLPYQHLSGDYYDYRWDERNQIFKGFLFDVMGHGVVTALQVSALRVLFRQVVGRQIPLAEKVEWMNQEAIGILPEDSFAAATLFEIDLAQGKLAYVMAGINHFLLFSAEGGSGVKALSQPGTFLGITEHAEFEEHECLVRSGDGLIFLTDGFYDLIQAKEYPIQGQGIKDVMSWLDSLAKGKELTDDATALGFILGEKGG